MSSIEARLARLEAIEAIKRLKARYWQRCDAKDIEGVRDCFMEGPVEIHYDGPVGLVDHRDGLYDVFKNVALQNHIVEMHHGGPPQITVIDANSACGTWGLVYHLMDTEAETLSIVGGYYDDEYTFVGEDWKISKTRFRVCSAVTLGWKDAGVRMLYRGNKLPE